MSIWFAKPDLAGMTASGANVLPGLLDIEFTAFGDDWLTARMPVQAKVHQPFGRLHGGASVVLGETVASVGAIWTLDTTKNVAVGMEINANHARPVSDGFVTCTAKRETAGRTSQIWTWRVEDDAGRAVCIGRITMAVISNTQR